MEELHAIEQDWKFIRSRIQGAAGILMNKLNTEYAVLHTGVGKASDKFRVLDECPRNDRKSPGVIVEMPRSKLLWNLAELLERECDFQRRFNGL